MRFLTALFFTPAIALIMALPLILLLGARLWNMAALPVWDPSEARYATLAVNMERTGDFMRPAFWHHGTYQTFAGKPPLAFQAGGLACAAFGRTSFAVRLPSFLAALGTLALLYWGAGRAKPLPLLATMVGFLILAGVCMTDMPLTFAVTGMLVAFRRYAARPSTALALLIGLFAALGFLTKGPVALALGGLPAVAWVALNGVPRSMGRNHAFAAALLFLALALPWFLLMGLREPGTLRYFFLNENVGRFLMQSYGDRYGSGHKFFFGVAVPWLLLVAFPWGLSLFRKAAWRRLRDCFPAIATLTMAGFWCLTPRVPVAYLLPAAPMLAWWLAERPTRGFRWWPAVALAQAVLLLAATPLLPRLKPNKFPVNVYLALPERATLSFENNSPPYSAEFYLGDRVCRTGALDGDFQAYRKGKVWHIRPLSCPTP